MTVKERKKKLEAWTQEKLIARILRLENWQKFIQTAYRIKGPQTATVEQVEVVTGLKYYYDSVVNKGYRIDDTFGAKNLEIVEEIIDQHSLQIFIEFIDFFWFFRQHDAFWKKNQYVNRLPTIIKTWNAFWQSRSPEVVPAQSFGVDYNS